MLAKGEGGEGPSRPQVLRRRHCLPHGGIGALLRAEWHWRAVEGYGRRDRLKHGGQAAPARARYGGPQGVEHKVFW